MKKSVRCAGLALASIGLLLSNSVSAVESGTLFSEGGLKVTDTKNKCYWFKIGGRLHLDSTIFSGNAASKRGDYPSSSNLRRARLEFSGGIGPDWSYKMHLQHEKTGSNVIGEAFVRYDGIDNLDLVIGQFAPVFGLENSGSNNDLMFLEQSLGSGMFAPDTGLGVAATTTYMDMFTLAAHAFHPKFGTANVYGNAGRNDRLGEVLRVTYAPCYGGNTVYHLGASFYHQAVNGQGVGNANNVGAYQLATTPEAVGRSTASLVSTSYYQVANTTTGGIKSRTFDTAALEAAAAWDSVNVQGEYFRSSVKRIATITTPTTTQGNIHFKGWHAQVGYVLTGEVRPYDFTSGTFGRPTPASADGAWEIAARYSAVSLIDNDVRGGRENNFTLGLNWYINKNFAIRANYIKARITPGYITSSTGAVAAASAKRNLNIFGVRFQAVF